MTISERISNIKETLSSELHELLNIITLEFSESEQKYNQLKKELAANSELLLSAQMENQINAQHNLALKILLNDIFAELAKIQDRPAGMSDLDYIRLILSKIPKPTSSSSSSNPQTYVIKNEQDFANYCLKVGTLIINDKIKLTKSYDLLASIDGNGGGSLLFPSYFAGNLLRPIGNNITINKITFDTEDSSLAKSGMNAIKPAGVIGLKVTNCIFNHVGTACMFDENPSKYEISNCIAPGDKSIRRYFVYFGGTDGVISNNTVQNSHYESCIRGRGSNIKIIANNLRNVKFDTGGPEDDKKEGCIAVQDSINCVVENNKCLGDMDLGANPIDEGGKAGDLAKNLTVKNNTVSGRSRLRLIDGMVYSDNKVNKYVELHPTVTNSIISHSGTIKIHDGIKWYDWTTSATKGIGIGTKINL